MGKTECFYLQSGDYLHMLLLLGLFFFYSDTLLESYFPYWLAISGLDSVVLKHLHHVAAF